MPGEESEEKKPGLEAWEELHRLYVDDVRQQLVTANRFILIIAAGLLTLWLGGIRKSVRDIVEIRAEIQRFESWKKALARNQSEYAAKKDVAISEGDEDGSGKIASKQQAVTESKEKVKERFREGVMLKIFGCEFPLPPLLAPSIWLSIFVAAIVHMGVVRRRVFKNMGMALGIEDKHLGTSLHEKFIGVPWWVEPLPQIVDASKCPLDHALGLKPKRRGQNVIRTCVIAAVYVAVVLVLADNMKLVSAGGDILKSIGLEKLKTESMSIGLADWQSDIAKVVPPALVLVAFTLLVYWLKPEMMVVDTAAAGSTEEGEHNGIKRRRFINLCVAGAGGVASLGSALGFAFLVNREKKKPRALGPRFQGDLNPLSIFLNANADRPRYHISSPEGGLRIPKRPAEFPEASIDFRNFRPEAGSKGKRIAFREAGWELELMAAKALEDKKNQNRFSAACEILLCGIRHDLLYLRDENARRRKNSRRDEKGPNLRLYELLAGLSVRFETPHLSFLEEIMNATEVDPKAKEIIDARMESAWKNPQSKWMERWKKRKTWEISVADGPDKASQKKVLKVSLI